jgi:hypothetical protein
MRYTWLPGTASRWFTYASRGVRDTAKVTLNTRRPAWLRNGIVKATAEVMLTSVVTTSETALCPASASVRLAYAGAMSTPRRSRSAGRTWSTSPTEFSSTPAPVPRAPAATTMFRWLGVGPLSQIAACARSRLEMSRM